MKKFAKLSAVFAALVLALSCFVACSNGDDDSASVQALQGLWIDEKTDKNDIDGMYILNNTMYYVCSEGEKYYYDEEGEKFSISGNQIIPQSEDNDDIIFFEINSDDTLTITYEYPDKDTGNKNKEVSKYYKKNTVPIKLSSEEFENKFFKDKE